MRVIVGSTNPVKVEAVREAFREYKDFREEVEFFEVSSDVSEQPMSLDETFQGAFNRARNVHRGGVYSSDSLDFNYFIEIEDGLIKVGLTEKEIRHERLLNVTACVITSDLFCVGRGLGCGFEPPPLTVKYVLDHGANLTDALCETGITEIRDINRRGGIISLLTSGKTTRKDRTKEAIGMAFVPFQNPGLYGV